MLDTPASTATFRAARDLLLERGGYEAATANPLARSGEFNGRSMVRVIAAGNARTGRGSVGEDGSDGSSHRGLPARSGQLANGSRQGVVRGDRLILMLGDQVERGRPSSRR